MRNSTRKAADCLRRRSCLTLGGVTIRVTVEMASLAMAMMSAASVMVMMTRSSPGAVRAQLFAAISRTTTRAVAMMLPSKPKAWPSCTTKSLK